MADSLQKFKQLSGKQYRVPNISQKDINSAVADFENASVLEKLKSLGAGASHLWDHPSEFIVHSRAVDSLADDLKDYYPNLRADRSAQDKALNYAGGYDWGLRTNPEDAQRAIDAAKAYQMKDYLLSPITVIKNNGLSNFFDNLEARRKDSELDYLENKAGIESAMYDKMNNAVKDRDRLLRESVIFGEAGGYAQGGSVDTDSPESAISDYSQLLDAYPNANKFLSALKSSVMQHLPSQEDLRDPQKMMDVALNFGPSNLASGLAGVIKPKGGNWRSGQIEREIESMKLQSRLTRNPAILAANLRANSKPEELATPAFQSILSDMDDRTAVNDWLQTKFTKYVKNEMGTPEDPVRALAERGILHINPPDWSHTQNMATEGRKWAGHSLEPVATTELGKKWENIADASIIPYPAKTYQISDTALYVDPWLSKLDPESLVYSPALNKGTLGIGHLTDELYNAIRKESDLPEHLRLDPSKLSKVSMPQAVELVDKINKYRAAEMARANLEKSRNAATVLHKDYPEQGMSWVELKHVPDADPNMEALKNALAYEGQSMGHCVGGYCPDIISGKSRIFSLRDAKGEPHITIETGPGVTGDIQEDIDLIFNHLTPRQANKFNDYLDEGFTGEFDDAAQWLKENAPRAYKGWLAEVKNSPPSIVQIKGKQNKTPNEKYLPFVQDFVRSGKWSDIGDQHNTGLSSEELMSLMNEPKFAAGGHVEFNPDAVQSIIDDFEQGEYGLRHDAETEKGRGYLNELKRPDGKVMTEYSITVPVAGHDMDVPTLVPSLSIEEVKTLLNLPEHGKIPSSIIQKAAEHAEKRVKTGKSVFATPEESEFGEK